MFFVKKDIYVYIIKYYSEHIYRIEYIYTYIHTHTDIYIVEYYIYNRILLSHEKDIYIKYNVLGQDIHVCIYSVLS